MGLGQYGRIQEELSATAIDVTWPIGREGTDDCPCR